MAHAKEDFLRELKQRKVEGTLKVVGMSEIDANYTIKNLEAEIVSKK